MKKIFVLITLFFLLVSCGEKKIIETEAEKSDFFIKTKKISSFKGDYKIKKTGKIIPNQEFILKSEANGRVLKINSKFGDEIYIGKNLITLSDNIANYGLNLEKSRLSTQSSIINYESTKISLDKNVNDLKNNLEKVEKDYENLKKTIKENIDSSLLNLEQSKTLTGTTTTSSIQIEKIENSIKKAELDFKNLKKSNIEQIKSFEITSKNDYINLKNLFSDIINFSDNLLGTTDLNKRNNDKIEAYLGKKNSIFTNGVKRQLEELIIFKLKKIDNLEESNFDINSLSNVFLLADEGYPKIIKFMDDLEKVLDYSIENINFTRVEIDGYKAQINGYQTSLGAKYNSFLNFKANTKKFLNTYKDLEKSNFEQISLLKKDLELVTANLKVNSKNAQINFNKTELSSQNLINGMETSLRNSKLNLDNAIKTRDITLKQLQNSIEISKNNTSLASNQYSKLFIKSPIKGVITDILIDKGQDVNVGMPLLKLSGLGKNEVEIGLSFSEINLVKVGDKVEINYLGEKLKGNINSISPIADSNLNYKAKISIDGKIKISGNIVDIIIPIKIKENLIPLENLKVKSDKVGEISILKNYKIKKQLVNYGKFYGEFVEILSCVDLEEEECKNLKIITNDITKFDENKFELKVK